MYLLFRKIIPVAIGIVVILVFLLYHKVSEADRFYFSVQGFSLKETNTITIGRESGLCYDKVPKDYMTITRLQDGRFRWDVDRNYKDSLLYCKVGGVNTCKFDFGDGDCVKIGNDILISDSVKLRFDKCVETEFFRKKQNVKYIMVRNMFADVFNDTSFLSRTEIKSFFYRDNHDSQLILCILDDLCKIVHSDGSVQGFNYSGIVAADSCKVQFFLMSENSYMPETKDDHAFSVNGLYYTAKPVVLNTEWGAGHFKCDTIANKDGINVSFPKSITFVERFDTLKKEIKNKDNEYGVISVKQNSGAFPLSNAVYIPAFSDLFNIDLCTVEFSNDGIIIRDNGGEKSNVASQLYIIPRFNDLELGSDNVSLSCKVGIIDGVYVSSFLILPILIFMVIMISFLILYKREKRMAEISNKYKIQVNLLLSVCIFAIAFVFYLCKTLIAIKLSYTYPYFEKIAGINVVSVSLAIILAYSIYSLFSIRTFKFIDRNTIKAKRKLPISTPFLPIVVILLTFVGTGLLWEFCIDKFFNASILNSYMSSEVLGYPRTWTTLEGMNDTHRTVLWTLALAISIILAVLIVWCMADNIRIRRLCRKFVVKFPIFRRFVKIPRTIISQLLKLIDRVKRNRFVMFLIVCVILILLNLIRGNFATAFISFTLIFGLSYMFENFGKWKKSRRWWMFFLVILLLCPVVYFSTKPDSGYITNWIGIGIVIYWIYAYNIVRTYNYPMEKSKKGAVRSKYISILLLMFAGIILVGAYPKIFGEDGRTGRRLNLLFKYDEVKDKGYRYTESDVEFMVVMSHYMQNNVGEDPLSNEKHILHPSISSGQSPVILNDVSIQSSFFSAFGWIAKFIYFALLIILLYVVCTYTLYSSTRETYGGGTRVVYCLNSCDIRRMFAVFMWVSTSMYLYLSYCGILPFTGRLNPGYGVDSVGEALETALLIAFMASLNVDE